MRISVTASSLAEALELGSRHRGGFLVPVVSKSLTYDRLKRALDLVIASICVVLLSPVMVLVAALIKLTSPGPVLFKQTRAGLGGKPFTMYKFRTMNDGAHNDRVSLVHLNEQDGPVFKIADDPRLTVLGRFLRQSSIDELPQLFNVLAGQMSLVGPRPLWMPEARSCARGPAALRMAVAPGLTCLWQISGRSELAYERWVKLDLCYVRRRGILLDILILIQTVPAVLFGRGAY